MSHPFGDLLGQYLHRRHGLSQFKLADGINQSPSVISEMCQGKRLTGPQARTRIVEMILWLLEQKVLQTSTEANELLNAAGFSPLNKENKVEADILKELSQPVLTKASLADPQHTTSGYPGFQRAKRNSLPHQFTHFFGRSDQIVELVQLMKTRRLITLTGAGGVGKTRLAIEVANRVLDTFDDGVWFIDLAPLSNTELVSQKLLEDLKAPEQRSLPPIESIITFLRPKKLLFILDNCEHLIEGVAHLADRILRDTLQVSLLTTSREALHIPAEFPWKVPSLTCPPVQFETQSRDGNFLQVHPKWLTAEYETSSLEQFESVKLFIDRVQNRLPSFKFQKDNAWAVAHVCSRLDGIPLALEMAAAWIGILTIEEIATRLSGAIDTRFHMLSNSSRTVSHRQQTLRATMEWSYALLSDIEQQFLIRLPVFAGSWTADAAETICSDDQRGGIRNTQVLSLLAALIDKSLVIADQQNGYTRYRMLETIRQYAYEKLVDDQVPQSLDYEGLRDRHLAYFVEWVEQAEKKLLTENQPAWLDRFQREHENIRNALEWGLSNERCAEQGLRLAVSSSKFFLLRGYISEGRSYLTTALNLRVLDKNTALQALGITRLVDLAYYQSDFPTMHRLLDESLSIWHSLGLERSVGNAYSLMLLGELVTEEGNYATANRLYSESLCIHRSLNNEPGICELLIMIGWAAMRTGDYAKAQTLLEESLELARKTGYAYYIALALSALGELTVRQGKCEQAKILLNESLALRRARGDQWGVGTTLGSLGWAALLQGDFRSMRAALNESANIRLEIGDKGGLAWCLEKLAEGIFKESQKQGATIKSTSFRRAVCIYGAAAAIRGPLGSVIDRADQTEYERYIDKLRHEIGEKDFTEAWNSGEKLVGQEQGYSIVLSIGLQGIHHTPVKS